MFRDIYYFVISLVESVLNLFVIVFKFHEILRVRSLPNSDVFVELNILGNGPSLKVDFDRILSKARNESQIMCVNSFGAHPQFDILKPRYYIISDKAFFNPTIDSRIQNIQRELKKSLREKVNWEMILLIPSCYKKTEFVENISNNRNIIIHPFPYIPLWGGFDSLNVFLYKNKIGNPPFQNILIAAIFQAIGLNYKVINIWGADHSWVENYSVGIDNNLYTKDVHFYDDDNKEEFTIKNRFGDNAKVFEEFESLAKTFKAYHLLQKVAVSKNIQIYNYSCKSWIDAFKKNV